SGRDLPMQQANRRPQCGSYARVGPTIHHSCAHSSLRSVPSRARDNNYQGIRNRRPIRSSSHLRAAYGRDRLFEEAERHHQICGIQNLAPSSAKKDRVQVLRNRYESQPLIFTTRFST
ncbi:hypothetical protein PFISCL1PPCAC_26011, partial [Pristionchus fissidentatus]